MPVLLDKGRYLLVDLDPVRARSMARSKEPCFAVRALEAWTRPRSGQGPRRLSICGIAARSGSVARPDAARTGLVDRIRVRPSRPNLAELVALPTRFSTSAHYPAACDIVEQKLAAFGYATSRQTIRVGGSRSTNVVARRVAPGRRRAALCW